MPKVMFGKYTECIMYLYLTLEISWFFDFSDQFQDKQTQSTCSISTISNPAITKLT